jgi:hypothetical protein
MATSVAIGLQPLLFASRASQLIHAMSVRLAILAIHVRQLVVVLKAIHAQRANLKETARSVLQDSNQIRVHNVTLVHHLAVASRATHDQRENLKTLIAQSVHSTVTHVRHDHSKTADLTAAIA